MAVIKVAFWNLQNLFDTTLSEIAADLEFTPEHGWDDAAYSAKVANLAEVIGELHGGTGTDLLGLCEIENQQVCDDLIAATGRADFALAHSDAPDIRGIDTSLIYSTDVFELVEEPVGHKVFLRYPTRDIFEVRLRVRETGAILHVLVNHWPSRKNGLYESEPYRITVAHACGRLVDAAVKIPWDEYIDMPDTQATMDELDRRWNENVLLMGDFNDEPYNRSVLSELRASSGIDKLEEPIRRSGGRDRTPSTDAYLRKDAYLFNAMWPCLGQPDSGTLHYSGGVNTMNLLDQFIISRGLYYGARGLRFELPSVEIVRPPVMTTSKGRPIAFDKQSKRGYSDHFPIQAVIRTS